MIESSCKRALKKNAAKTNTAKILSNKIQK